MGRPLSASPLRGEESVLILGAGPTGLGAARELERNGHLDWTLLEAQPQAGGLASSFVDDQGFTWDVGGHVQFSHYPYFDQAMNAFLGSDGWLTHQREAWIWMCERFIPYPLQSHLHHLPEAEREFCLQGLRALQAAPAAQAANFGAWIDTRFGVGLAEVFMRPYNAKVWAYAPELLNTQWMGERVAAPDPSQLLRQAAMQQDARTWGPNRSFQFPRRGGTGAIWRACAAQLPSGKLHFQTSVDRVDLAQRRVTTTDGRIFHYDRLLSTLPLRELIRLSGQDQLEPAARRGLLHSSSYIVGLGLRGQPGAALARKCWMYFPEDNCPFYRVTVFSNYAPANVPDSENCWSLMFEVAGSQARPVDVARLLETVVQGALNTGLFTRREDIVSIWQHHAAYGYPTPGLHRDEALARIIPFFEHHQVSSRGRFGLWKYEVSNQDHAFMQGVEWVGRLLNGRPEHTAFSKALV